MASDFDKVGKFHQKFGLPMTGVKFGARVSDIPVTVPDDVALFRLKFMLEELKEIAEGYGYELVQSDDQCAWCKIDGARQDLPKVADGLIDLSYVTLGTAHLHLLPWPALFTEVQRANMSKERASHSDDERSTRKHSLDVVKPVGFVPPQIIEVLMAHGWNGPPLPLEDK